ncbi:MAG: SDR family NAD(P)-dependent oxidoreductase [Solirubrobacteraceae bacterium]|nr:SDR family NAD(P)-dependent oxidoreductase [Patulibacter sp.]
MPHAPALPHPTPLAGRTAVVTGAGRGLGAAIARRLAHAGARVVLVGRTASTLRAIADELDGDPLVVVADLAEADAAQRVFEAAVDGTGRLDVLVNNAGRSHNARAPLTAEEIDDVVALNLRAPLQLATLAADHMARNGGGSIVTVSSSLALLGTAGSGLYAATKGGVEAATRSLAAQWGPNGVRVNAVRPAITRSDMSAAVLEDADVMADYLREVPLGEIGEPEDIAALVQFLATDESAYVTGQVLDADGGWGVTKPAFR